MCLWPAKNRKLSLKINVSPIELTFVAAQDVHLEEIMLNIAIFLIAADSFAFKILIDYSK